MSYPRPPSAVGRLLAVAAGCVLVATVSIGLPHAWVSVWLLLALIFAALGCVTVRHGWRAALAPLRGVFWAAALFVGVVLARFAWGLTQGAPHAWSGLGHYVAPLFLVVAAVVLAPWLRPFGTAAICWGAGSIAVLFALAAVFGALPDWRLFNAYRVYVGNDAIWLGIALAIVGSASLLRALHHLWEGRGRAAAAWAAFGLVLAAALAWFGQSRSALLIFGVTLIVGSALLGRRWWQRVLAPALVAALLIGAYAASPVARDRIATAGKEVVHALALYQVHTSQGQRLALASVSLRVWHDAFWWGHGLGTWRSEFAQRVPPQWKAAIGAHSSPHNEYLHVLGQMGLIGLAAYLLLLGAFVWAGVRCLVRTGAPWLFALTLAWVVGSLTNVFLWDYRFFAPFAAMLTCALACVVHAETANEA